METLAETFASAGWIGPVLMTCALVLWYGLGARAVALRRPRGATLEEVLRHAGQGRTVFDEAIRACRAERVRRGGAQASHLEAVVAPYLEVLGQHGTTVRSVTAVAPLLGLLGTVSGMIETFDSLGSSQLFAQGGGIGGGIAEALITTELGLVVAVPGLLLGSLLDRRQATLEDELATAVERLAGEGAAA